MAQPPVNISRLIEMLEDLRKRHGDIEVWVPDAHLFGQPRPYILRSPPLGDGYEGREVVVL